MVYCYLIPPSFHSGVMCLPKGIHKPTGLTVYLSYKAIKELTGLTVYLSSQVTSYYLLLSLLLNLLIPGIPHYVRHIYIPIHLIPALMTS